MNDEKDFKDDGTLACLGIPPDPNDKSFHCPEIKQQKLVNLHFTVLGFLRDIKTKYGSRHLVHIQMENGEEKKFFTNSKEIKYILGKLEEIPNGFPRKVLLNGEDNRYWFS